MNTGRSSLPDLAPSIQGQILENRFPPTRLLQYTDSDLQGWVNALSTQIAANDAIIVLNPVGMVNQSVALSQGTGGYHAKAYVPYVFVNMREAILRLKIPTGFMRDLSVMK